MILLLLGLAVVATFALVVSGTNSIGDSTPTDMTSRGRWGVLERGDGRGRRLNAHERRWQTALTSARHQSTRWPDLVTEIRRLEYISDLPLDPSPPDDYDADWVEDRLVALERHLEIPEGEHP